MLTGGGDDGRIWQLPVRVGRKILDGGISRLQLQHATGREGAAPVIEKHYLGAQVQRAANLKDAAGIAEHLVEGQAQFIQVEAGGIVQGVK